MALDAVDAAIDGAGYVALPTANHDFSRLTCGTRTRDMVAPAFAFQMTWPTLPVIYFGDEIGMRYVPGLPDKLDAIVQKMLAKDPALRFPTPGLLVKELRGFQKTLESNAGLLASGKSAPEPVRPLRTFMTWLETKRADDRGGDASPAGIAARYGQPCRPTPTQGAQSRSRRKQSDTRWWRNRCG